MEVLYNALEDIDMKEIYLTKKCCCSSELNIINEDVFGLIPDKNNKIYLRCPCCGSEIQLYKYFEGKKYSFEQYAECIDTFKDDVFYLIRNLCDINMGYGEEYFNLAEVHIVPCPARIYFYTYINKYKQGDWSKKNEEHTPYPNNLTIDITSKIVCGSIYEYAQYTQALTDYIVEIISSPSINYGVSTPLSSIDLQVENDMIIKIFRNPDIDIYSFYFSPTEYRELVRKRKEESRTILTPDIKSGLKYTGDKIEKGCLDIQRGLFAIGGSIHDASIRGTEDRKRLDVSIHGHIF